MSGQRDESEQIKQLQQQLQAAEEGFEPLRERRAAMEPKAFDEAWAAQSAIASGYRRRLFELAGDAYGRRHREKLVRPSEDDLNASYDSPDEVPEDVRRWVAAHAGTLTSDATDAVRWHRIADTLEDERYPEGEEIVLYRAVADGDEIRPGDWASTERAYAEAHLRRYLNGRGRVVELEVDGADVLVSPTGNAEEAIYAPREFSGPRSAPVPGMR